MFLVELQEGGNRFGSSYFPFVRAWLYAKPAFLYSEQRHWRFSSSWKIGGGKLGMETYLAMAVEFALRVLGSMFWIAMVEPAEHGLISACYTDLAM